MADRDPDLVLYGEDHLYTPDRERYVADIEDREPEAILLEELGSMDEDETDRLIDLYDSFGTIDRAREHLREEYGEDPLPGTDELYEAVEPGIGETMTRAYETVRDTPGEIVYRIAGIDAGFGDREPTDPDDLATTPVYAFDPAVLEDLTDAIDDVADDEAVGRMTDFYEYLAAEQDTLTRLSHEIYDHAAEQRRDGHDIVVAGCERDADEIDIDMSEGGLLETAQDAAADLDRANRERERSMAESARGYVDDGDGTVAMVVGDGHLGYTGLENRLRFDDFDIEVNRSVQDHHRRREELAGLLYIRTMRSQEADEAADRFTELLEAD